MKNLLGATVLLVALALPLGRASAQPTDLSTCLAVVSPTCNDVTGALALTECSRFFEWYYGRVAWYPLLNAGPITVSVEALAFSSTRIPLYVEVVPLSDYPCDNPPGFVIMTTLGSNEPCGLWTSVGPIDISHVVPIGSTYALRLHFIQGATGLCPAVDCVRVVSSAKVSDLEAAAWGLVKRLYR